MSTNGDARIVLPGPDWRAPANELSAAGREARMQALLTHVESLTLALNQHGQAILSLRSKIIEVDARLMTTEAALSNATAALDQVERDAVRWGAMMFWQRLRWLLRGPA